MKIGIRWPACILRGIVFFMLPKKYRKYKRKLKVRKSRTGLGLFTEEPINKGEFVVEYVGPVLTSKEADLRGGRYLFETNKNRFVDGSSRSNLARYINHACKPNCVIEILKGRIYVFSKRKINAGEELNYDYDTEYFNDFIKPVGCKCDSCLAQRN